MKPIKEPTNIYEVVVTETRAVTYLIHAKTSGGATAKSRTPLGQLWIRRYQRN